LDRLDFSMRHYYADKIYLYRYIISLYICSRLRIASGSFSNEKFYLPKEYRVKIGFDQYQCNELFQGRP